MGTPFLFSGSTTNDLCFCRFGNGIEGFNFFFACFDQLNTGINHQLTQLRGFIDDHTQVTDCRNGYQRADKAMQAQQAQQFYQ